MSHILDRPIWSALNTRHAALAQTNAGARRYPSSVSMFAAAIDGDPESIAALAELPDADKGLLTVEANDMPIPEGFEMMANASLVQMVASERLPATEDARIVQLGEDDAAEMLALATLTKPGPFSLKAQSFGSFWGVKADGRLVAMAGQRLKQPGYAELSGVCTHPDAQGQGLGRLLSLYVAREIQEDGDLPYLHAYAANARAITLYESIGFRIRTTLNVTIVQRLR
jgi:predicted GNAT family acetyltransferase